MRPWKGSPTCVDAEVRSIPGYSGYVVTADGRVYGPSGRQLRQQPTDTGHLFVNVRRPPSPSKLSIHRAVLLAWVGPCPEGWMTRHLDGNPANNHLTNLVWGTRADNERDRYRHAPSYGRGERNNAAKLTERDVREIRRLAVTTPKGHLARRFGVTRRTIRLAVIGETWQHVVDREVSV